MDPLHAGSCLCGAVAFAIDVEPVDVSHCHCSMCRKAHGAAFATYVNVATDHHRFTRGEDRLRSYNSSGTTERVFCGGCGSPMLWIDTVQFPGVLAFPLAALDGEVATPPQRHIFVGSKASWYEICDKWPQAREYTEED